MGKIIEEHLVDRLGMEEPKSIDEKVKELIEVMERLKEKNHERSDDQTDML